MQSFLFLLPEQGQDSIPTSPFEAISEQLQVRPAAPISCAAITYPVLKASKQASINPFSRKGSPTCTAGRSSIDVLEIQN